MKDPLPLGPVFLDETEMGVVCSECRALVAKIVAADLPDGWEIHLAWHRKVAAGTWSSWRP